MNWASHTKILQSCCQVLYTGWYAKPSERSGMGMFPQLEKAWHRAGRHCERYLFNGQIEAVAVDRAMAQFVDSFHAAFHDTKCGGQMATKLNGTKRN